jgi:aldehyde dehydrogenase (NAD+)
MKWHSHNSNPKQSAKVATLIAKAGFPHGVINVLSGHGSISGAALSSHMDVRCITFTGSLKTGRLIQEAAAKSNIKNVILELGGKSPAIIFDDCDLEKAAEETQHGIQFNSGQTCMANTRIYVQNTIADQFIALFKEKFSQVTIGDPLREETSLGPLADNIQYKSVSQYIASGKESGKIVVAEAEHEPAKGYFVQPTIFTNTPEDAKIMKEEVFGPVVNINVFHTEEEAVAKANDTEYGLYASVYTKNIDRALRCAQSLQAGSVGVNCTSPVTASDLPFGGHKSSGSGRREGIRESLDNFLEVKTVMIKIDT